MSGILIVAVLLCAAVVLLALLFFPLRPLIVRGLFPLPPRGAGWYSGSLDGIPYLVEGGLPYSGSFAATSRARVSLDGPWELRFDPEGRGRADGVYDDWRPVSVPSVFNAAASPEVGYLGVVWYRVEFEAPFPEGGRPRLRFDGVLLRGSVILNGEELGSFEGGYTPRFFDASCLRKGRNTLLVRTDNRLTDVSLPMRTLKRHNPGWHTYGGIYRSVKLEFLPDPYILKASFRASVDGSSVLVEVLSCESSGRVGPDGSVPDSVASTMAAVFSFRGDEVAELALEPGAAALPRPRERRSLPWRRSAAAPWTRRPPFSLRAWTGEARIPNPAAWSPDDPAVYSVTLTLGVAGETVDRVVCETGFRTFVVEGERLLLNGAPVFLKGVCKHEDHPDLGPVQTPELIEQDLSLIAALGANYVRLAHYPHDVRELAAARDRGLMVSEELPLYQAGTGFAAWVQEKRCLAEFPARLFGLRQLARRRLLDNARRQAAEMVERDRNNPAIVFWSVGNECYTLGRRAGRIFSLLRDTVRYFDASRPVTNVELVYHISVLDRMKRGWTGMDLHCLNSYFGWYYGSVDELPAFLDSGRGRWGGSPLILSEFGADAARGRHDGDGVWLAERVAAGKTYSEEYQARLIRAYWAVAAERPYVAGFSPWVFADFYNTWFPHNPVPNYNLKGLVSARREPKAAYYALQELYRGTGL